MSPRTYLDALLFVVRHFLVKLIIEISPSIVRLDNTLVTI